MRQETHLLSLNLDSKNAVNRIIDRLTADGMKVIRTKLSHGSRGKSISKGIFGAIARQTALNKSQLQNAVKCPLSRRDYSNILKEKNLIASDLP